MGGFLFLQLNNILIQGAEARPGRTVPMVVAKEPGFEAASEGDLVEIPGQRVLGIAEMAFLEIAYPILHRPGSAVGDDMIDRPAAGRQITQAPGILLFARQLTGPPAAAGDPVFDVVGGCAAHGEDPSAVDLEYIAAQQMIDIVADAVGTAAHIIDLGQGVEGVEVLVVAVDIEDGIGLVGQPVEPVSVLAGVVPQAAKIAADQKIIVGREFVLLGPVLPAQALYVVRNVNVAGDTDHGRTSLVGFGDSIAQVCGDVKAVPEFVGRINKNPRGITPRGKVIPDWGELIWLFSKF